LNQGATEEGLAKETEELVSHILKQHRKGFRKHSNMLVFLAPDQQRSSEVIDAARRLLALRNIDDDKPTKKQLSEEQLRDLADRLKEAEARLPAALATVYRFILVPGEKKVIRRPPLDMGISSYSGRTTLSSKVLEKLTDEQQLLDKLDPAILIGPRFGLWPEDQEAINVRTLADYFTQLTHLPRLHGSQVLPDCLAKGVQPLGDRSREQPVSRPRTPWRMAGRHAFDPHWHPSDTHGHALASRPSLKRWQAAVPPLADRPLPAIDPAALDRAALPSRDRHRDPDARSVPVAART